MSWNFLAGLASFAYLSTQGHTQARSIYKGPYATGDRSYADKQEIAQKFDLYAKLFIDHRAVTGGCTYYSELNYPATIWGWRCKTTEPKIAIWMYAGANDCTINELSAREGQAHVYLEYGIEDYSDYNVRRIWLQDWGNKEYVWRLYPHPINDKLRIDKEGNEWYYISKEYLYAHYLRPARKAELEKRCKQLFKE